MESKAGNTMVNVTVNVDKDVLVEVITEVIKDSDVAKAVGEKAVEVFQRAMDRK